MVGKRFTDEELKQIETMKGEGVPVREMARRLGRSSASVKNLCYRKRRDAMRPFQPQEQSHESVTHELPVIDPLKRDEPTHIFGVRQHFCPAGNEKNPDFKDETVCDDCGLHLGAREVAEKLSACPNCGNHKAHLIT